MKFNELLPNLILTAVSQQGYQPTGVFYPLNSYENRVYEIAIEGSEPLIGKFYRPGRWDAATIATEHQFLQKLTEAEIPVVASIKLQNSIGQSPYVSQVEEIYYSLFPKFRGRQHAENSKEQLAQLGRTLARLHNVGEQFSAPERITLNPQSFGWHNKEIILQLKEVPPDLQNHLSAILDQAIQLTETVFHSVHSNILVHGDCHPGNILWNNEGPHLLDFDDMIHAPPIQDLWMLFFGETEEQLWQKESFFEGYETFRSFDMSTFRCSEALRTLRMIRHTAWIGQRFQENIFQQAFPYFSQRRYWEEFLLSMKEQISAMQERNG